MFESEQAKTISDLLGSQCQALAAAVVAEKHKVKSKGQIDMHTLQSNKRQHASICPGTSHRPRVSMAENFSRLDMPAHVPRDLDRAAIVAFNSTYPAADRPPAVFPTTEL
eukprot:TRINITY_DN62273_c0_g1_i2.p2 TRINITY_DN62273_c0_g1~~TRINITY_DN62273_c0_g1_i2.p2  ORF type:complete len:110 (-),score=14.93 TRINITY_DN62273_c0_g1_i2:360-689(-)